MVVPPTVAAVAPVAAARAPDAAALTNRLTMDDTLEFAAEPDGDARRRMLTTTDADWKLEIKTWTS